MQFISGKYEMFLVRTAWYKKNCKMWYVLENEKKSRILKSQEKKTKDKTNKSSPNSFPWEKNECGCLEDPLGAWEKA